MQYPYARLALAIAGIGLSYQVQAAGLDRSGQDVTAFLQQGTYAEAVYTHIDPSISGYDNTNFKDPRQDNSYAQGRATGDIAKPYDFFRYGVKADLNDAISIGVIYDEPFGALVEFKGDNNFVSGGYDSTFSGVAAIASPRLANLPVASKKELVAALSSPNPFAVGVARTAMWDKGDLEAQKRAAQALGISTSANLSKSQIEELKTRVYDNPANQQAVAEALGVSVAQAQRLILGDDLEQNELAKKEGIYRYKAKEKILDERQQRVLAIGRLADQAELDKGQGTKVDIHTSNITALAGVNLGEQRNIHIYGGPAAQRLKGKVQLRGTAYGPISGYNAQISPDQSYGWVAGVAYTKPEIALKAALTYRSKITHKTDISEEVPALPAQLGKTVRDFSVTLPESYNLDFQTGVNPTTLVMAKVRYVPWKKFSINPPTYGDATERGVGSRLPIVSYDKNQWSAEVGVGKKLSDKLSVSTNVGWDSGAGNPTSTLGPVNGYYSVGLGAKYNLTPEISLSAGGKYLKFGDAVAQLPTHKVAGKFAKNDGYIVGAKLAYQHK